MPDNSMYVEPVVAVNADMSGVQNPSMYKPVHIVNMPEAPTGGVTSVNGQTGDVTLTASDVGALPSSTVIPSKTSDLQNDSGYITASDVPEEVQTNVGSFELAGDNPIEVKYTAHTHQGVEGATVPGAAGTFTEYIYKSCVSFDLNDFHKAVDAGFNPKLKINQDITGITAYYSMQIKFSSTQNSGGSGGYTYNIGGSTLTAQTFDINTILSSTAATNTYRYLNVNIWGTTENTEEAAQALADQMLSKITLEDWPKDVNETYAEIPNVDQTYNASSTNAQSGVAVAGAIAGQASKTLVDGDYTTVVEGTNDVKINFTGFPTFSSADAGKVLTVQADGTLAWV